MKVVTAREAAQLLKSGDGVMVSGSGGGHCIPESILVEIEQRYLAEALPRDLCLIHVVGLGDRATKGVAHFCHDGMIKRSITSALIDSPTMIPMVLQDKIESYTLPQGVLSQITRDIAGGRPGLITKVGLHTFLDPRQLGGRQSPSAKEDLIELMTIDGEEWLRYKPFRIDVALLRGTTADEDGNVTMEHEALFGEMLSTAQACRRQGGIVIVEVKRLAKRNTLPPKNVKIPGILVDYVVVDPAQRQTYATEYSASYAGELRVPLQHLKPLPFSERKIVARRAAMEIVPGAVCNLGAGISTGISAVAAEENILDDMILTNEQGFIGGAPLTGVDSGTAQNYAALVDAPYQFDFYDGGGLDIAFLSFAEVDPRGNVNISRFGDKIVGVGGFINISQNARKTVFSGTFTAGGLQTIFENGRLRIVQEGRHRKFVGSIEQICYNATFAAEQGRTALFVTERALFRATVAGLELVEIAPGIDIERDILAHMDFKPAIAVNLKLMDSRLFAPQLMGLASEKHGQQKNPAGIARMSADAAPVTSETPGIGKRLLSILWGSMPALVFVALIAIWWAAVSVFHVASYLLPPPQDVLPRIYSSRLSLWNHSLVTMQEIIMGFGLSVITAIPMGLLIALSPAAKRMLYPFLVFIQLVPKIAIAPLFVVWVGFGMTSKVLLTLLLTFFPLLLASIAGFQILDQRLLYLTQSLGATFWQTFRYLRFPAALPVIFGGLKTSATIAATAAIVAEFVGANKGLGYILLQATGTLDTTYVFAILLLLTIIGLALNSIVELAEYLMTPWRRELQK